MGTASALKTSTTCQCSGSAWVPTSGPCSWPRPACSRWRRDRGWNWRSGRPREDQGIGSGGQVNRLIGRPSGERRPAINFAHRDLTRCEQRPEQHRGGLGRGQHRLGLDPALEFLVKPLDGVGGSGRLPLAGRQSGEGEELLAGLLQAVGDGPALEPPLAQEGFAALLY